MLDWVIISDWGYNVGLGLQYGTGATILDWFYNVGLVLYGSAAVIWDWCYYMGVGCNMGLGLLCQ